jgi:hypothetical protein
MRPGSVVGPQQNWLESMESQLLAWGQSEQEQRLKAVQELAKSLNVPSTQNTGKQPRRQATGQRNSNLLTQLDRNEGTEALTETSMGMRVPVQPNKLERVAYSAVNGGASNYTATGAEKTSHYNLRNVQDYPDDDHVSNASGGSSSTPRSRNGSQSVQGGLRVGVMTRSRSRNLADSVEGENNNSNNSTMFQA